MEAKYIIISIVKSNNSENNVWAVAITGEEKPEGFCKSAYKAMRFAFLLKKRTGVMIDDASLKKLSECIAEQKAKEAEASKDKLAEVAQEFVENHSVDAVLEQEPKKARKSRKKSEPKVISMQPAAQQELIAFT
jgi:L-lactate utilization protein LutC